ncbi:hypothetical protein [Pseudactinotalea sp. Z1732]
MTSRVTLYRRPDGDLVAYHYSTGAQVVDHENAAKIATDIAEIATGKQWAWLQLGDQNDRAAFYLNRLVTALATPAPPRAKAVA